MRWTRMGRRFEQEGTEEMEPSEAWNQYENHGDTKTRRAQNGTKLTTDGQDKHRLGKDVEQEETEETERKFNREPREIREPFSKVTTDGRILMEDIRVDGPASVVGR